MRVPQSSLKAPHSGPSRSYLHRCRSTQSNDHSNGGYMKIRLFWLRFGCATLSAAALAGATPSLMAAELPPYMNVIVGGASPGPGDTARQNVLALNTAMFGLYDNS